MKYKIIKKGEILKVGDIVCDILSLSIVGKKIDISLFGVKRDICIYSERESHDIAGKPNNYNNDSTVRKIKEEKTK